MRGKKPTPRTLLELGGRVHKKKIVVADFGDMTDADIKNISFTGLPVPVKRRAKQTLAVLREKAGLNSCDAEPFARYLQHLRLAHEAYEKLKAEGLTTVDENGLARKHPANQIHRENSLAALRYEEQFGLTPSARMRLRATDQIKQDKEIADFNEFVNE